jgi:transcriptional regulator of NAD metabolism
MSKPAPKEKYVIEFAKDNDGNEIKHRFMMVSSQPIKSKEMAAEVANTLGHVVNGVDNFEVHGRYTFEVMVARTFDPDEVVEAIREEFDRILSPIAQPNKTIEIAE